MLNMFRRSLSASSTMRAFSLRVGVLLRWKPLRKLVLAVTWLLSPALTTEKRKPTGDTKMPLVTGAKAKTKKGFSQNIEREMKAGKKQSQAVAIAYSEADSKKKKKKAK